MMPLIFLAIDNEDDKRKIEQIWHKYHGLMQYEARKILDDDAAEDAVSEAYIKIIRNIHKFQDITSYQTRVYIVSIVRSTSIDVLRNMMRLKGRVEDSDELLEIAPDGDVDILGDLLAKEGLAAIETALASLPDHLKDVICLHLVDGISHVEIARMLGITEGASKMRLLRAKERIRKRLAGEGYEKQ